VVAALKEAKEAREAVAARRARVLELLTAEGLQHYQRSMPSVQDYISSGEGSEEAVLAAAREKRAADQRREAVKARLVAEGLPEYYINSYHLPSIAAYINRGKGSEDEAVAAAVARHQLQQARVQRHDAVLARLAAEQLPADYTVTYYGVSAVLAYIESGDGSEEGAMEAARAQHQLDQARAGRRDALRALLQEEQLPTTYLHSVPGVTEYIHSGEGSQVAAMEAARAQSQLDQAEAQRRAAIMALLAAEQLPTAYMLRVVSVREYISTGKGSEEGAMAAARAHHQEQLPRLQRDARVVDLLTANLLPADYRHYVAAIEEYISTGGGTEESVLAAARAHHHRWHAYDDYY
jgi:hypothetical protein